MKHYHVASGISEQSPHYTLGPDGKERTQALEAALKRAAEMAVAHLALEQEQTEAASAEQTTE